MADRRSESGTELLAQRTFFTARSFLAPEGMYAQAALGVAVQERERVVIGPHALVTTNTYFGRFPASYWQRWTEVGEVTVEAVVTGSGKVSVCASDSLGNDRVVTAEKVSGVTAMTVRLTAEIDRFVDGGALWLDIETDEEPLTVEGARWLVNAPRPPRPVSVVICTHNRAEYCLDTLAELASDAEALARVAAVHVTDQGDDSVESHDRFPAIRAAIGAKLRYRRQTNLGGAGGFARGMYEVMAAEGGENAHVLLMDDDVKLESDTVIRLGALADCTVEPTIVGGQNLCELHPGQLFVDSDIANLPKLRAGVDRTEESLSGRSMLKDNQDRRVDATHNAWWCCLVPAQVVARIGYPLPIFFQWDDVEYGLRARAAGFFTVTLPGAGVWHQDLHWKGWDDWSRYFHYRNGLITAALRGRFDPRAMTEFLVIDFAETLASMQYGLAATIIKAIEDFLRGPEVLADGGTEVVPAVRKLRAEYPETQIVPAATAGVPADQVPIALPAAEPSMPRLVLVKRLVNQFRNAPAGGAAICAGSEHWWHVSLFRTVMITDSSQTGVRVRKLDRNLLRRLGIHGLRVLWRLRREGEAAVRGWQDAERRLTSKENWERLFGAR
jgi:galactofuranosylgalactofuranosylrhamnosyl-N-acetylglucosaminyl-diphospho-decaprenol beta-1,5/1,6-galactofuranosyltransferase